MRRIFLFLSLAALIACRGNVGGHHHHHDEDEGHVHGSGEEIVIEPGKATKLGIETITAEKSQFSGIIRTSGKITGGTSGSWDIVAGCSGKISFIKKDLTLGSRVGKSEILFSVDSRGMNNQNNAAELEKGRIALERMKNEYDRALRLKDERLITENEFQEAKGNYFTAKTDFERMNSTVGRSLSSPSNGYITSVNVENGQYVEEGSTVATVSTGKDIVIEALLPARYSHLTEDIVGANFSVGGKVYQAGKLITSSDIVSGNGTFIPVSFKAEKNEGVAVGMAVEVFIKISEGKEAVTLPKSAVSERLGRYFVYRKLDEECYAESEVVLGECDGIDVEIKSGVEEGDEIVTEGVYYVRMAGNSHSIPHGHSH